MARMDSLDLDRALSFYESLSNSIVTSFILGINYINFTLSNIMLRGQMLQTLISLMRPSVKTPCVTNTR